MARGPASSRDPAAPKVAKTAQQHFAKERRVTLQEAQPELKGPALAEKLAEEWAAMPDGARKPFHNLATADKERYNAEQATYVPAPEFLKATKGGGRLQKDPLCPKKPKSAYLFFGEATRTELMAASPGVRIDALSKLIGEEWRKLSDSDKEPYQKLAEDDQERYRQQMETYEPSEEYLAAKKAFKKSLKGESAAGSSSQHAAEDDDEDDDDDEEEGGGGGGKMSAAQTIKELKKELAAKDKQIAKLEAKLEKVEAKAEKKEAALEAKAEKANQKADKASEKAAAAADKAKAKAKGTKKEPVIVEDESHYVKWTKKVLGAKGEKADEEMLAVLDAKGPKGLVKLLAKRYKSEKGM